MGFWTGRTPKKLRLYEWRGNSLVLPFGLCRDVLPMLRAGEIRAAFTEPDRVDYGDGVTGLYDYQEDAVSEMIRQKYGILKSAAGSGKSNIGLAIITRLGVKALWLCAKHDLLKQSYDRALQFIPEELMGTITEGKVNIGKGITFATVQTLCNADLERYRHEWNVIIVDECFPSDTMVETNYGRKKISEIKRGDYVWTVDKDLNLSLQKVETIFSRVPFSLVKIALSNKNNIVCTSNHPILTERGYVCAGEITNGDAVCCMRGNGEPEKIQQFDQIFAKKEQRPCFLFRRMQKQSAELLDSGTAGTSKEEPDCYQQSNCVEAYDRKQSNDKTGNGGNGPSTYEGNRTQARCSRWERNRIVGSTGKTDSCAESTQSGRRICNPDKSKAWMWISNLLQGRHRNPGNKTGNRDRRGITPVLKCEGNGQEKNGALEWVGVDSVEIQEQTGDGTFGGLCPDGRVYNIGVKNNHNYFANGVNVHNCHNVATSATTVTRYQKVLNNLSAPRKIGLTATPARADGLIKATFSLIGNVVYEVPESAVADKIMKVTVRPVETQAELTDACLNVDGTLNYTKMIEHLTTDAERNKLIAQCITEEKNHSCLILSNRLSHLESLKNLLPPEMQEKSARISGKMTRKKDKALREEIMDRMRSGELRYLFASYSISREGLDIPRLDRLFMATPEKFSSVIIQSIGRIARTFPGKEEPIAYDFIDSGIVFCKRAWKERCKHYRKVDAKISQGFL